MITGRDAREELRNGVQKYKEAKTVDEKLAILFKLITVLLKVVLVTRVNTVIIAKKVGAKLIESERKEPEKKEIKPE